MKKLAVLIFAFYSSSSIACPNLRGSYDCDGVKIKITQETIGNNVTLFAIKEGIYTDEFYSDNKTRTFEDTTRRASCSDDALKIVFRLGIFRESNTYSLNKDGNLVLKIWDNIIPHKFTCRRQ